MNFGKYHESRNLLNEAEPPQNIYITDSIRRMGYEVEVTAGTYTAYGDNSDLYAKTKINGVYSDAVQINNPQNLTLNFDGIIIIYSRVNGEFPEVNIMLNSGSTALPYEPYSSEVWHDIPYYVHNTSTDTITTLPADIYPNAATATVGLKGQVVQSGTPTPDNPIMPEGTGERTGNLFNPYTVVNGYYTSNTDGELKPASNYVSSDYIEVEGNTNYYITPIPSGNWGAWYDENKTYISGISFYNIKKSPVNAKYVRLTVSSGNNPDYATNFMIAKSSVSIPYEPYGYKLPISSASITTPVYLGEVQTTRKIKKLVLTGEETGWQMRSSEPSNEFFCSKANLGISALGGYGVCNVYQYTIGSSFGELNDKEFIITTTNVGFRDLWVSTAGAWIYFLQQQYANGTPVTIWYVLANEETGIVNEPLMKIGGYADEVSNVSIPVTAGGDTLSVDTTVQPSEITANYHGWHPAIVHERTNSAWT